MTLTQLRYLIAVAHHQSYRKAAAALYVSQPSLSKAVAALEEEMGIIIFHKSSSGVVLTDEGQKFLGYAHQVIEQADLLLSHYKQDKRVKRIFAISAQHYAFVVNAFVSLVKEYREDEYEFSLREERTFEIIEDVKNSRSELGVLYLSSFNRQVILHLLGEHDLDYQSLFKVRPQVFLKQDHPLSGKSALTLNDLLPYPRLSYDQGINNSFYFAEEPHSALLSPKNIVVTDRATLFNLLIGLDGYTIASGILSTDLNGDFIISIPLISDEYMELICVSDQKKRLSHPAKRYVQLLSEYIQGCLKGRDLLKLEED